ncbi:MAG TPA: uroporphyrinogen decarboxylase family protein [Anaerolineales bacterium]|nr:uroporphyrinogen decarboxylase family protein [Anaerolineales bacterium]HRF46001.1 uroporphyrinogen decarboxylase family protein [Anaerolineales bacterium]
MTSLSKRERVEAALSGAEVDRVPVSAWRHFLPDERSTETLAAASLGHFKEFDWDWLKLNPRATYYAEAWGNIYDYDDYDGVLPRFVSGPINAPADLPRVGEISGTAGVFGEQLSLIRQVRAGIGDAHFLQTVFSPLSVLAFLVARPTQHTLADAVRAQVDGVQRYIHEDPQSTHAALKAIAHTLARYAAASVEAGASGIFFAIVKLARQGVLTEAEYEEFGRPYDWIVLKAVQEAAFNLLHICGAYAYLDSVAQYPVHAINWATVGQYNPTVQEARQRYGKALVGGVDELDTLQNGQPGDVIAQAQAAIQATGGRGFLLTPGCGTHLDVPARNLHALRSAVEAPVRTA